MKTETVDEWSETGFSLIEMLVVVAIVSLTATIAFSSFHTRRPNSSPRNIIRDIGNLAQMIRMDAINRRRPLPLNIDIQTRTISNVDERRRIVIPASIALEVVTGKKLIHSQKQASIVFFPDGSSSGGAITLLTNTSEQIVLRIPWLTGIPTIVSEGSDHEN